MTTNVLLLIKGLGRGGAEQLLASAAPYYDRERFSFRAAYLLPWKDALVKELADQGIPSHCLDGAHGVAWIGRLRSLVRTFDVDLIHSHSPVASIGARVSFHGPARPRRVYTEHNVWERYHRATYWGNLLTFSRSDQVFAVSEHVRDSIRYPAWMGGLRMPPVQTLIHGIDQHDVARLAAPEEVRSELGIPAGAPLVGTVANLKAHKRLDVLIDAMAIVRRDLPDTRLVIVGQGALEESLRRQVRQMGLNEVVLFTGFREDAQRIASAFDVFALSSEHEGLSIALVEALALGKSAVVTDVGGLSEVVTHRREGLLVRDGDPHAFAAALRELLEDADLRRRMGEQAKSRALDFDIRVAVREMEATYERLIGAREGASR